MKTTRNVNHYGRVASLPWLRFYHILIKFGGKPKKLGNFVWKYNGKGRFHSVRLPRHISFVSCTDLWLARLA